MNDATIGTWSYRAGDWFAVFGSGTTLLLPESERERVIDLWAQVDGGAAFTQVLDGLLTSGLSSLPGFVLVETSEGGPTRVLLRGEGVRATLTTDAETVDLDGAAATTWVERTVDGVTALSVIVGDDAGGPDFAIDGGLVRVSRIDLPPAGQLAPAPAEAPPVEAPPAEAPPAEAPAVEVPPAETGPIQAEDPLGPPPAAPPEPPPAPAHMAPWPEPEGEPEDQQGAPPETPAADAGPDAEPNTADMPLSPPPPPPTPPSFDDVPPPPAPEPGPWGDGGFAETAPPPPPPAPAGDSDHDGHTQIGVSPGAEGPEQPGIPGQPMAPAVTRPVAKLIISSGETVDVDRVVLIGRAPEARRFSSTDQPKLVTVPSPMHEISSTHIEVRPGSGADHGSAVVTDMGSTNGTVLVQPGLPPEDLKPGIAVQLIPGAIINLGDGLTIQVARP